MHCFNAQTHLKLLGVSTVDLMHQNAKFFHECYHAYKMGRAESDPSIGWYKGELGFFDFYIIPLAKKLKDCGVFGVSSDEYLNYAVANRKEWEAKGQEVVKGYIADYRKEHGIKK